MRPLKEGMVLTVEPGCYFNDFLLQQARKNEEQSKFLVWEELDRFIGFGGVRIEDDCIVRATHCEVMTVVPRTIEDIEGVMAGRITNSADLTVPCYKPETTSTEAGVGSGEGSAAGSEAQ